MKKMGMLFPTNGSASDHMLKDITYQDPNYLHRYRIERQNLGDHGPINQCLVTSAIPDLRYLQIPLIRLR